MASTSSSIGNTSQPLVGCGKYDVFINHRGIDTKDSLASAIYHALESMRVRAFLDREELEAGEEISHSIEEAIWSASVHVAIFSPNYAKSRWCLDELKLLIQTGKKIIPIFYRVEVSHVRWLKEDYSQAFSKHENDGRYKREELEEWKKALFHASNLFGYVVNDRQNDEGLVVEQIVNDVMREVNKMALLDIATHPVGLDEAIGEFQNFVETQYAPNVKIVGIVGLGGCGKTTLAKEYFNQKRSSYTKFSFLSEVREAAANNRLLDLQQKLLQDLVDGKAKIHDKSEGKRTLERRVRSVKALIVLDDVDKIDQIEALLPLQGNLQPDSLVIVTTRDSGVIESSASLSLSVSIFVYRKRGLDPVHAKQLFCWHAFLRDSQVKGFEDLVEEFLKACQELPLSLKVLGGQLHGKNENYWKSQLHKISKILPDDIKQRLKVSYDALDEEQQHMFLDIACFFIGEQKDMAISIWDGSGWDGFLWSGWHGFQILQSKCVVEVDHDNCIRMHDHLRDLGREIAIKTTPSRFWSHSQFYNSQRSLEERLPMRGIMAATGSSHGYCNLHYEPPFEECMQLLTGHSTSWFRRILRALSALGLQLLAVRALSALGLQLLAVRGDYFKEQFAKLSEELVWLRWYDFPHEKLPSWLSTEKLRVLELYEAKRLTELWGPNDAPSQLTELIITLSGSLQMIPETIGFLKHLKKIVLKIDDGIHWSLREDVGVYKISSLPEEFCLLESLEHLELAGFICLSSLPTHFGNLRKLKYINLRGCQRLTALPVSFKQLTGLQYLDLSWCMKLQLEKSILENITKLEKVRLLGCYKLQQLPSEITRQMYLRELCLSDTRLRELPADIDRLAKLQVLEIESDCLTSLPTSLGNLSSLVELSIKRCNGLEYLASLANLSCLILLKIISCEKLTHLPPVGCLTCLETLDLEYSGVECLPDGFGQLVNLQNLEISHCPIRELPLANTEERHCKFPRLKRIDLRRTKLSTISISEDCCPSLEDLDLFENQDLMEIKTLPTKLKRVDICRCEKLKNIRGVVGLVDLQRLVIRECPKLDELPSFASYTCLEEMDIRVSSRVTKIEGLEELKSLKWLRLETYWKLPGIQVLKNQDKLTTLQIRAESRSAIELCIPGNILKRPCRMDIVGRVVEYWNSFLEYWKWFLGCYSSANFTVVNTLHHCESGKWEMEVPLLNASCVIGCFVISCRYDGASIVSDVGRSPSFRGDVEAQGAYSYYGPIAMTVCSAISYGPCDEPMAISLLEGKQVYIGVWPKDDFMIGSESRGSFLTLESRGHVQIEKGRAVIIRKGEEEKASEALQNFFELLKR